MSSRRARFSLREPADLAPELLLGLLADAAGVQHDHVGRPTVDLDVPGPRARTSCIRSESWTFIWQPNVVMEKKARLGLSGLDAVAIDGARAGS